jgi:aromatic ring-opening dioxygenase catalytic subunit (LigB family)
MLLIEPKADIPIVQVSVLSSEDPADHFAMGQALAKLRDSNVAIIGSGFASFHNLRILMSPMVRDKALHERNIEWNKHVTAAAVEKESAKRLDQFKGWRSWPGGKEMHPFPRGGEHFMPLIVCAGAGEEEPAEHYTDNFADFDMYSYYWK